MHVLLPVEVLRSTQTRCLAHMRHIRTQQNALRRRRVSKLPAELTQTIRRQGRHTRFSAHLTEDGGRFVQVVDAAVTAHMFSTRHLKKVPAQQPAATSSRPAAFKVQLASMHSCVPRCRHDAGLRLLGLFQTPSTSNHRKSWHSRFGEDDETLAGRQARLEQPPDDPRLGGVRRVHALALVLVDQLAHAPRQVCSKAT